MSDMNLRNKPVVRDPSERSLDFGEVCLGFTPQAAALEAQRCLGCKAAPCMKGCPVGVQIPRFIACLKDGDVAKAKAVILKDSSLPSVCGRVCPQENQCEKLCVRAVKGQPVAIGLLERFVADNAQIQGVAAKKTGKRVAVVGSGPAGLACAGDLIRAGVDVTVFEAFHKLGGVLVYGIPEFRLPKALVEKEVAELAQLGVTFEKDVVVDEKPPLPSTPARTSIQPVAVVPILAPMIMPIALASFIRPELTKPTTITVVADDD